MSYNAPPRHNLFDLQGDKQYQTGVKWHLEPSGYGNGRIICTPSPRLNTYEVERLGLIRSVIVDREIEIRSDGVLIIEVRFGEKFGWILGKVASFYRLARRPDNE